jgi:hypothetical protein
VNVTLRSNQTIKGIVLQDTFVLVKDGAGSIPQPAPIPLDQTHPARRLITTAKLRLAAAALVAGPTDEPPHE